MRGRDERTRLIGACARRLQIQKHTPSRHALDLPGNCFPKPTRCGQGGKQLTSADTSEHIKFIGQTANPEAPLNQSRPTGPEKLAHTITSDTFAPLNGRRHEGSDNLRQRYEKPMQ